jgi:hypothetical protein
MGSHRTLGRLMLSVAVVVVPMLWPIAAVSRIAAAAAASLAGMLVLLGLVLLFESHLAPLNLLFKGLPERGWNWPVVGLLLLIALPLTAHLMYSWMGFNPTDEGYYLAISRRLMAGQIPHVDFIAKRPVLTSLLFLPVVALAGDSVLWVSRLLVWLEFAALTSAWIAVIRSRHPELLLNAWNCLALGLLGFPLTAHHFPPMAWTTIDGLFFASVGIAIAASSRERPTLKLLGYLLIGLSYLGRQTYIFAALAAPVLLNDWQKPQVWLAAGLPGAIYLTMLGINHGIPDFLSQVSTQGSINHVGSLTFQETAFGIYLTRWPVPFGVASGIVLMLLASSKDRSITDGSGVAARMWQTAQKEKLGVFLSLILICSLVIWFALNLMAESTAGFRLTAAFAGFGVVLGMTLYFLATRAFSRAATGLIILLVAWGASLSPGYNTPALGMGALILWPLAMVIAHVHRANLTQRWGYLYLRLVFGICLVVTLIAFHIGRQRLIYAEAPADQLTYSLSGVFYGAKGIRTNETTFRFLRDLQSALERANTDRIVVYPDIAAYWITSAWTNPLPIDWPQTYELNQGSWVEDFNSALDAQHGDIVIVVQKVKAWELAFEPQPVTDQYAPNLPYIREHFTLFDETEFFELYR